MNRFALLVTTILSLPALGDTVLGSFSPEDFDLKLRHGSSFEASHLVTDLDTRWWTGYGSFELELVPAPNESISVSVYDANGKVWTISSGSSVKSKYFKRLKAPLAIRAKDVDYAGNRLKFSRVLLEFTKTPGMSKSLTGKFGFDQSKVFSFTPLLFANATIEVKGTFFDNYEAGTSCYGLTIQSQDGKLSTIDATNPTNRSKVALPLTVLETPKCHSSSLAQPEDPKKDYSIRIDVTDYH